MGKITHLNKKGEATMVDLSGKSVTKRTAVAKGVVKMKKDTLSLVLKEGVKKGDVLAVARIAGIMAGKKTPELIPLCHPIFIESIEIDFNIDEKKGQIEVFSKVSCEQKTGVEMEAMTAVTIACLTIYDMCKGVDKSIEIKEIVLLEKTGGKSGTYKREVL
ncbi:MAG: cyclic pyranopterin monophosphate synthase MoaC [Proteobacteria bacterium]|nr:cyclic pyranopterin monophosphate synthase MoaC [Pseudomonadota bacterium]